MFQPGDRPWPPELKTFIRNPLSHDGPLHAVSWIEKIDCDTARSCKAMTSQQHHRRWSRSDIDCDVHAAHASSGLHQQRGSVRTQSISCKVCQVLWARKKIPLMMRKKIMWNKTGLTEKRSVWSDDLKGLNWLKTRVHNIFFIDCYLTTIVTGFLTKTNLSVNFTLTEKQDEVGWGWWKN